MIVIKNILSVQQEPGFGCAGLVFEIAKFCKLDQPQPYSRAKQAPVLNQADTK